MLASLILSIVNVEALFLDFVIHTINMHKNSKTAIIERIQNHQKYDNVLIEKVFCLSLVASFITISDDNDVDIIVGCTVESCDGSMVGSVVGSNVGSFVGSTVGFVVGSNDGFMLGINVGKFVG